MLREDLERLERRLMTEVVKRRNLGGYNSEAECLMFLAEAMFEITRHMREAMPAKKEEPNDRTRGTKILRKGTKKPARVAE